MSIQQRGAATLAILSQDGPTAVNGVNNLGTYENISFPFHPTWVFRQPNFLNNFHHVAHWYSNYPNTTPKQLVVKVKKAEAGRDNVALISFIGNKIYFKHPTNLETVWDAREGGGEEPNPNGDTGEVDYDDESRYDIPVVCNSFYPRWHDAPSFDLSDKTESNELSYKTQDFGVYGYVDSASWPMSSGASLWVECTNLKSIVRKITETSSVEEVEEPMQCEKSEIKYTAKWGVKYDTASCWSHGCQLDLVVQIEKVALEAYPMSGDASTTHGAWDDGSGAVTTPLYGYSGMFCHPAGESTAAEQKRFSVAAYEDSHEDVQEFEIEPEKGYLKYVGDFWIEAVYH